MASEFQCTVVTPEQELLDQAVTYASIPAWDGQVGIQERRLPLLTKLGYGRLRLTLSDGSHRDYFVGGGFAQMKDEQLTLLTDEATPAGELTADSAKAALKEAMAESAAGDDQLAQRQQRIERARAMVNLATSHN
jgi:F-type H+-transporting ATPase subunit epsilon